MGGQLTDDVNFTAGSIVTDTPTNHGTKLVPRREDPLTPQQTNPAYKPRGPLKKTPMANAMPLSLSYNSYNSKSSPTPCAPAKLPTGNGARH
ncbi:hypothetical protein V500_05894 [Pseudogymnoascus sp. VKM F-4518 (FW-2643)]|nr:hypothetical protein V500_05894 [Pseudogymnoascus sp. VKM F-4518 (FW-2643)]